LWRGQDQAIKKPRQSVVSRPQNPTIAVAKVGVIGGCRGSRGTPSPNLKISA